MGRAGCGWDDGLGAGQGSRVGLTGSQGTAQRARPQQKRPETVWGTACSHLAPTLARPWARCACRAASATLLNRQ